MLRSTRKTLIWGIVLAIVVGLAVWVDSPKHPSIAIGGFTRDLNVKLGLDLKGGTRLEYRANVDTKNGQDPNEALAGVRDVIERRVNAFGVSEPLIQTSVAQGEYRVIVELAGVQDPEEAKQQIGKTPTLDFRREPTTDELKKMLGESGSNTITGDTFIPTGLSGKNLKKASVEFDQVTGTPQITLLFDSDGTKLFAEITKANIGKPLAIYIDGELNQAPTVQSAIPDGRAVITGSYTLEEAKQKVRDLNSGALPVPIALIGQSVINPSLGQTAIAKSIKAGIVGIIAVIAWLIFRYRLPGVIASIALLIYVVLFFAIMKLIPVTLTLAGIAGFIMSIGMAVDANVLIFERFRENIKDGKTVPFSLKEGFNAAWSSISASNISSLITGFVLYGFGTSIIRGFALTFSLGIILSMFTAIAISKSMLNIVFANPKTHTSFLLGAKSIKQPTT
ncbi:MAG: protein-export membrane protein SecD [Candidatus Andersenbacteria bacterium RIFCSPHIGHO2_12_FULL_45_11b]|uniref:Protein translocase subunit SecD n=1 Tax=Candidatus Andersenbacteria bacterium RIFCSPHIGHO2_12_FULL_45_11b TaxID=1797282 RepID=A0A1G1X9F5_9BACT|nr:MAG: protein-export membrane protein SecD [Candidatus Andersenbacteria bacterium RIFCSPHIGHO2_12_FULL_45_11b]